MNNTLSLSNPLSGFILENYQVDLDDYLTLEYYFETDQDPYETAAHLCQEQSTAQYKRIDVEEDFRPRHASKVISVERNTYMDLFEDESGSGPLESAKNGWWAKIAYPYQNFGARIPNLITAICGEGVFHSPGTQKIKLMDIHFPDRFLAMFEGPQFGIAGIREMLGVYDRPIMLGVIKPNIGLDPQSFAALAFDAWRGGLDIAKDDELLCDTPVNSFSDRSKLIGKYRLQAEAEMGRSFIYLANITDEVDRMLDLYDEAVENHVNAVMINGMTTGLSIVRVLAKKGKLPLFSHFDFIAPFTHDPTFGVHLKVVAKLHRLAGFDCFIYQGLGSRMRTSKQDVLEAFHACIEPMGSLKPCLPVPGGSQWAGSLAELYHMFNSVDFGIVPGRAVFSHPSGPAAGAKALLQGWSAVENGIAIEEFANERSELKQAIEMRR